MNQLHLTIKFTTEKESENATLPFLGVGLPNTKEGWKPTNKDDCALPADNERTKMGIFIGFFLRTRKIFC